MKLIQRIKENVGIYILHFIMVCIVAPALTGILLAAIEFILGNQEFSKLMVSSFAGGLFAVLYGSIVSIPLALISLFIFKWLIDKNQERLRYFIFLGAIFGALTHSVFLYLGEGQNIQLFLVLTSIGIITGYFLHAIWKESYTKRVAT